MKVLQLSSDDFSGGAQRAAYRLHCALLHEQVDSRMRVLRHQTANDRVIAGRPPRSLKNKIITRGKRIFEDYRVRQFKTDNLIMHTFGSESAGLVDELNRDPAEVLNLHWISQLLSIKDIARLRKPIVWTFHDMWAFCGGEHVAPDQSDSRFRAGYLDNNRPAGESGPDLNREAWEAKRLAWATKKISVVTPSQWLAKCVRESVLFRDAPVHVIPNPLEMQELWRPMPRAFAKAALGLDLNKRFILAGSAGGMPHLKGEDLLRDALAKVVAQRARHDKAIELLIFGQYQPATSFDWPCPVHWLGPIRDDHVLATAYAAADVMVVPSRQDNLPNTAVEAQACGIPVAAFSIGGLPDIVKHQETGWLAPAFDTSDLASGIIWILDNPNRLDSLSQSARALALKKYANSVVAEQYQQAYEAAVSGSAS
jgi:glycosyltransferase involved in cell wall biosynthesis